MNPIKRLLFIFCSLALLTIPLMAAHPVQAAQFYADQSVTLSGNKSIGNVYAAGRSVTVTAPATNDVNVAGNIVNINSSIDGNLNAAGGNITVDGTITHSARLAGGSMVINGHINQDLVVFGGDITLGSSAVVDGDMVVFGGTVAINGPVHGHITAYGGDITVNSAVGSLNSPHLDSLTLGSRADIKGDLTYSSPHEAQQSKSANVRGSTSFNRIQQSNPLLTASFFYDLLSSLIFSLVLLYIMPYLPKSTRTILKARPWPAIGIGLLLLIFTPIAAILIALFSPWLGIAVGLLYALCLITAYPLAQILLGGWLLDWWYGRNKQAYHLDWRAVVIGIIAFLLLSLVWVIGWLILAGFYLAALGSLAFQLQHLNRAPAGTES